jgi:hypothetical protein
MRRAAARERRRRPRRASSPNGTFPGFVREVRRQRAVTGDTFFEFARAAATRYDRGLRALPTVTLAIRWLIARHGDVRCLAPPGPDQLRCAVDRARDWWCAGLAAGAHYLHARFGGALLDQPSGRGVLTVFEHMCVDTVQFGEVDDVRAWCARLPLPMDPGTLCEATEVENAHSNARALARLAKSGALGPRYAGCEL